MATRLDGRYPPKADPAARPRCTYCTRCATRAQNLGKSSASVFTRYARPLKGSAADGPWASTARRYDSAAPAPRAGIDQGGGMGTLLVRHADLVATMEDHPAGGDRPPNGL